MTTEWQDREGWHPGGDYKDQGVTKQFYTLRPLGSMSKAYVEPPSNDREGWWAVWMGHHKGGRWFATQAEACEWIEARWIQETLASG